MIEPPTQIVYSDPPQKKMEKLTDLVTDSLNGLTRTYIKCFADTLQNFYFLMKGGGYYRVKKFRFEQNLPKLRLITLLYVAPNTPNPELIKYLQARYPHADVKAEVISSFDAFVRSYLRPHCVDVDLVTYTDPWAPVQK